LFPNFQTNYISIDNKFTTSNLRILRARPFVIFFIKKNVYKQLTGYYVSRVRRRVERLPDYIQGGENKTIVSTVNLSRPPLYNEES